MELFSEEAGEVVEEGAEGGVRELARRSHVGGRSVSDAMLEHDNSQYPWVRPESTSLGRRSDDP